MRLVLLLILMLCSPGGAIAQGAATLVADTVKLNDENQLIAAGNVEVLFEGSRLSASEIIYDQDRDRLQIIGPVFITTPDGTLLTADRATLDPRLENGILQGARVVLDQQLQLAANQIDRRDGRYLQLYKASATSCQVCGKGPPIWEIRAERMIHDQMEHQLYFQNATFLVRGVPLLWVPRMRLPDPTLKRSTGFLIPQQRNTSQLDTGIKLPYFMTLGDHRDLTLTPYISSATRTLEARYRQAFVNGYLETKGAFSDDDLETGDRSYLFAKGNFDLGDDVQLQFGIEAVSDPAYLLDYGYSGKDRLDSAVSLLGVRDRTLYQARFIYYQTLRDDESNASLPPIIADVAYEARIDPGFGGVLTYGADFDARYRYSDEDGDKGRDLMRFGASGRWFDSLTLPGGVVADGQIGLRNDLYFVDDDSAFAKEDLRASPSAAITLRWPLVRSDGFGGTHLIEPAVSLSWAKTFGDTPPNEDSQRTELDRANLFSLSRYAGDDAIETGPQAAAGVTWTRYSAAGGTALLGFGRVIRQDAQTGFTASSGLSERTSDWLVSAQLTAPGGFLVDGSSLWDDVGDLTIADVRLNWSNDFVGIGANYIWQAKDAAEDRTSTVSEWSFDAEFNLTEAWTVNLDGRYNVADDEPVRGGIGLQWQNECVTIDVSASRRYTSSSTVDPTTTYGLSGSIGGFSAGRSAGGIAAGCRN